MVSLDRFQNPERVEARAPSSMPRFAPDRDTVGPWPRLESSAVNFP